MTTKEILQFTNDFFGRDITSEVRTDDLVLARHHFYYFALRYGEDCKNIYWLSEFIGKNHASILHAFKTFKHFVEYDYQYRITFRNYTYCFQKYFQFDNPYKVVFEDYDLLKHRSSIYKLKKSRENWKKKYLNKKRQYDNLLKKNGK